MTPSHLDDGIDDIFSSMDFNENGFHKSIRVFHDLNMWFGFVFGALGSALRPLGGGWGPGAVSPSDDPGRSPRLDQ